MRGRESRRRGLLRRGLGQGNMNPPGRSLGFLGHGFQRWFGFLFGCWLEERCAAEVGKESGGLGEVFFCAEAFGEAAGFEVAGKAMLFFGEGFVGGEGLAPLEDFLACGAEYLDGGGGGWRG